ncbi:3',5'-cyclic-nucleotide phosphodiesterase Pde1 [Malassezia pachydermatis]|uniref:Cyclic-amp phosphodiesterase n=1 Tax=Malassezia pachydermatis TaxID=77020 RepID=A0A0M8MWS5_9BASI|nr:cyclic-amp phosphodiesterase [Malassezia pachydermatis]KOS15854.1 cyclic-amp phosphodiesterase [Malassezia pachydermatis]
MPDVDPAAPMDLAPDSLALQKESVGCLDSESPLSSSSTAFSFVCLGVGGGPFDNNCSCYLMKPADRAWHDGTVLVEGGSFLGSLMECLEHPDKVFPDVEFPEGVNAEGRTEIFNSWISQVFLSHGHLDHIYGLVLASANNRAQRPVYGLQDTLDTLLQVFNGRIWPRLASYDETDPMAFYHLRCMRTGQVLSIDTDIDVTALPISHGNTRLAVGTSVFQSVLDGPPIGPLPCHMDGDMSTVVSTAFLFTNHRRDRDVLFMGDVEPDQVSGASANFRLWKQVAPRAAQGKLNAIFLECSFSSEQPDHLLFGHMTPVHLYRELQALAQCVCAERKISSTDQILRGVKCIVIHIKGMTLSGDLKSYCYVPRPKKRPTSMQLPLHLESVIEQELADLEAQGRLGVEFIVARRGQRIEC